MLNKEFPFSNTRQARVPPHAATWAGAGTRNKRRFGVPFQVWLHLLIGVLTTISVVCDTCD